MTLDKYLAAAASRCAPDSKESWLEGQKELIKTNGTSEVLEGSNLHLEPESVPEKDAPVRVCYRYISNREGQFDYKGALEAGLPIGSEDIESGHRYVIQDRLKRPGAWWKPDNAQSMLALRVLRANDDWSLYWDKIEQQAA
jgi:hypothetical protein